MKITSCFFRIARPQLAGKGYVYVDIRGLGDDGKQYTLGRIDHWEAFRDYLAADDHFFRLVKSLANVAEQAQQELGVPITVPSQDALKKMGQRGTWGGPRAASGPRKKAAAS